MCLGPGTLTLCGYDHCLLVYPLSPGLCLLGSLGLEKRTRKYPSEKTLGHKCYQAQEGFHQPQRHEQAGHWMNRLSRVLSGWGPELAWDGRFASRAGGPRGKRLLLSPKVSKEFTVAASVNVSLGNGHTPSHDEFTSGACSIA